MFEYVVTLALRFVLWLLDDQITDAVIKERISPYIPQGVWEAYCSYHELDRKHQYHYYTVRSKGIDWLFDDESMAKSLADTNGLTYDGWDGSNYIDIYRPIAGWKAIWYAKDPDCGGMFTPWETGMCAYTTPQGAYRYAVEWAPDLDIPVVYYTEATLEYLPEKEAQESAILRAKYEELKAKRSNGM